MSKISLRQYKLWWRRTEGAVSVELALVLVVFLTIVAGVMDFGHAFYMQQVITTASREGARYGTRYQTNAGGARIVPNNLSPSIASWITTNYQNLLPSDASLATTVSGAGAASGAAGDDLNVTVNATKHWFLVDHFIPNLGSQTVLTATTVMKCE